MDARTLPRAARLLLWLLVLAPAWVLLAYAPSFGLLPGDDYYGFIPKVMAPDQTPWERVQSFATVRSNEHRITVPSLFYALAYALGGGRNLPLSFLSLALMAGVFTLLYRALPHAVRADRRRWLFAAILAIFVFTPTATENVAMGFSGVLFGTVNLLTVLALVTLVRRAPAGTAGALWPLPLIGLAAFFSFGSSVALWPALVAAGLYLGVGRRQLLFLILTGAALYGIYLSGYVTPRNHPPITTDPIDLARFVGVYLGSPFSLRLGLALGIGWAGLAAAGALQLAILRSGAATRRAHAPWLGVMVYVLGNAGAAAVARAGFGEGMAVAARYASLPALFWAALLVSAGLWLTDRIGARRRTAALAALATTVVLLAVPAYQRGRAQIDAFVARGSVQPLAALALVRGYHDTDVLHSVSQRPAELWRVREDLRRLRHAPFDRPWPRPRPERFPADRRAAETAPEIAGLVGDLRQVEEGLYRIGGWVFSRELDLLRVVILDSEGWTYGEVVERIHDPALVRIHGARARRASWSAYLDARWVAEATVYVEIAGSPQLQPLPPSAQVRRQLADLRRPGGAAGLDAND